MVLGNRENIINALLRIASKNPDKKEVTMSEIAEEAGISRQAIYQKHYNNVEDIFNDIHHSITQEVYETLEHAVNSKKIASIYDIIADELIPKVYYYRSWGKVLFHTSLDHNWVQFLQDIYLPLLEEQDSNIINHSPLPQKNMIKALMFYIFSIIAEWLSEDFPDPPEVFSKKFKFLMTTSPKSLIDSTFLTSGKSK
ncbi:TetR/AcrR family transcriptional regulator [Streptococcus sp. H49]|uniref:TetR/AcrR family transcriptional regulator n=1 Tax=Streptococcus huangxiaojuni TaxID=3237239 RepID=UPI0034A18EE6